MCVAVGILPVTGQPLPLISKGGTSTLINCAYIGMILSVSRFAKKREPDAVPSSSNEIESAFTDDRGIE
jgi:cell division protein FtsW